jgi:isochorismate synthase EntC
MFYLDCKDVQLVGASPETLCKVEGRKVYNHAIAGTVKRGKNVAEDAELGAGLLASEKDRAEHIMLVDLARNDVNRVCKPETVKVDDLMRLEKFSHVIHITSQISGILREDQSRFDAFRSIFPAGTVSGAPKVKAIQLVGGLEQERRGVYAGAVGRFDFDRTELDTCIAIRTMTFKDDHVYLQAGGGIVFDSIEEDECKSVTLYWAHADWNRRRVSTASRTCVHLLTLNAGLLLTNRTLNKALSNVTAIESAESEYRGRGRSDTFRVLLRAAAAGMSDPIGRGAYWV